MEDTLLEKAKTELSQARAKTKRTKVRLERVLAQYKKDCVEKEEAWTKFIDVWDATREQRH